MKLGKNALLIFGCSTLEDLAKNRAAYFNEHLQTETDPYWIGKISGSRDAWHFIDATIHAKGEAIIPAFLAECYMLEKQKEQEPDLDVQREGYITGSKEVYCRALKDIDRQDLIDMVDAGEFEPEQYMEEHSEELGLDTEPDI